MKTPEQMAEEYADRLSHNEPRWDIAKHGFLAGFKAGREMTDQEIVDLLVDMREKEAKERSKVPPLQQERHDYIWEKVKVKLVGIF